MEVKIQVNIIFPYMGLDGPGVNPLNLYPASVFSAAKISISAFPLGRLDAANEFAAAEIG
jgi:hypothetical protein